MSRGYLVDTSVLSLLAPGRPAPPDGLSSWLRQNERGLYISAVTVAEIEQGICKLRRSGGTERANLLSTWLDALLSNLADRVLALDAASGRVAGRLSDHAISTGQHPGFPDIAIAATAAAFDLVLLTNNGKHFQALGIDWISPSAMTAD